MGNLFEFIFS